MKRREGRKGMQLTPEERELLLERRQEKAAEKAKEEKMAKEDQLVEAAVKAVLLVLARVPPHCIDTVLDQVQGAAETRFPRYQKWKTRERERAREFALKNAPERDERQKREDQLTLIEMTRD